MKIEHFLIFSQHNHYISLPNIPLYQDDMTKQGIKIKQKGVCGACDKPIVGQVSFWHKSNECLIT